MPWQPIKGNLFFQVNSILDPIPFLEHEIKDERYLEGLVIAVMYFEHYGKQMLETYFTSKGVPLRALRIDGMKVSQISEMLDSLGLIKHETRCLMKEVLIERNTAVHRLSSPDEINKDKAKKSIEKAIICLRELGVT